MTAQRSENDLRRETRGLLEQASGQSMDSAQMALMQQKLETLRSTMQSAAEASQAISNMVTCVTECVRIRLELEAAVQKWEIEAQYRLEKLRKQTPMLERQLERMSDQVDKLVDRALAIDARTCSRDDLELRAQLLRYAQGLSQQVGDTLMRFMLI